MLSTSQTLNSPYCIQRLHQLDTKHLSLYDLVSWSAFSVLDFMYKSVIYKIEGAVKRVP